LLVITSGKATITLITKAVAVVAKAVAKAVEDKKVGSS
jgi:hypothetical protein